MTAVRPIVVGAVLAGGEGKRLGRDKAAVAFGDRSMLARAVESLRGAKSVSEVVVISSRSETPTGPWAVIPDERPACGPLGGIESALAHAERAGAEAVFVLACDLPLVDSGLVDFIIRALGSAPAAAAARDGAPDFEPLCAVYRVECLQVVRQLLDSGRQAAQALFQAVEGVSVSVDEARLANVNTQEDLDRAREGAREQGVG